MPHGAEVFAAFFPTVFLFVFPPEISTLARFLVLGVLCVGKLTVCGVGGGGGIFLSVSRSSEFKSNG